MALLTFVVNLATRWRNLHFCKFGYRMALNVLVVFLATRWRYLHYKFGHQMVSLALVSILATRWHHLHCWIVLLTSSVGLSCYPRQLESHQLSQQTVLMIISANKYHTYVLDGVTSGHIDRTPGTPGSDKKEEKLCPLTNTHHWPLGVGVNPLGQADEMNHEFPSIEICQKYKYTVLLLKTSIWLFITNQTSELLYFQDELQACLNINDKNKTHQYYIDCVLRQAEHIHK